jgi:transcriptional regulator with XRE-family HTH domain
MKEKTPNQRLRLIRELLQFNQTEFSQALGFKQSHISAVESEKKEVSVNIIYALVNKFKVSANWLLTGAGEMFLTHHDRVEYTDQVSVDSSFSPSSPSEQERLPVLEFIIAEGDLNTRIKELELCIIKEGYLPLYHLCELYAQLLNQPPDYAILQKNPLPNTVDIPANVLSPILTLNYSLSIFENKALYFKELEKVFTCWRQEFYTLFNKLYASLIQQENSPQMPKSSQPEESNT